MKSPEEIANIAAEKYYQLSLKYNDLADKYTKERQAAQELKARLKIAVETLEHYEPILRQYGCTKSGDHDDPSWCTDKCGDYGKRLRKALAEVNDET